MVAVGRRMIFTVRLLWRCHVLGNWDLGNFVYNTASKASGIQIQKEHAHLAYTRFSNYKGWRLR